jgi:hypothetical protein
VGVLTTGWRGALLSVPMYVQYGLMQAAGCDHAAKQAAVDAVGEENCNLGG